MSVEIPLKPKCKVRICTQTFSNQNNQIQHSLMNIKTIDSTPLWYDKFGEPRHPT